ncbi:T9SS type A sorting domain-containing protein [Adhaeribacter swui]|uniref:T9SS type A sorting domain-containing protein n=1 Tax=Adhaeribacter swui TaxID=2086471 RepID=A0A7G7G768_9BACT|nr:T9SS type A sorting domain-containing protein [Adhaeribacter swui]QNF33002.1 T9SS type A sorting domain-containing protein [Adhaeribacter swui]
MSCLAPLRALSQESCLLSPVDLNERAKEATLIVEAEVIHQESYWNATHQNIYTRQTLQIFKILKGSAPETITVITEGGRVGAAMHVFTGTLQLKNKDQGIFFLVPAQSKMLPAGRSAVDFMVYSSSQGFIRYNSTNQQAVEPFKTYSNITTELYPVLRRVTPNFKNLRPNPAVKIINPATGTGINKAQGNQRTKATPAISSFTPDTLTAGTGSLLTIRGSGFGSSRGTGSVQFRNADNGGASFIDITNADYIFWTDNEIQVRIPGKNSSNNTPGSGDIQVTNDSGLSVVSTQALVIEYAVSQVLYDETLYSPRLVNANEQGGYTFQFSSNFDQNNPAKQAFTRALNTWSCHTGINWNIGNSSPLTAVAEDNVNLVCFDETGELPRGILARCISRYAGCGSEIADQWRVAEMDVIFSQTTRWNYSINSPQSTQVDFETVTLHEMGHGHQLNHVIKPGTVMHYAITRGQEGRRLNARTDVAGGQFTMTQNVISNQCGPGRMIPQPVANCTSSTDELLFTAEITSNTEVQTTWSISSGNLVNYFVLERSKDAVTWQELNTVSPSPTTDSYQYPDVTPLPGISYYRLKVINPDQTFSYSPIVRIMREVPSGFAIAPNPVTENTLWLQYITQDSGQMQIYLYDVVGRLHRTYNRAYQPNNDLIDLDITDLRPGTYILVYDDGRQIHREKFTRL